MGVHSANVRKLVEYVNSVRDRKVQVVCCFSFFLETGVRYSQEERKKQCVGFDALEFRDACVNKKKVSNPQSLGMTNEEGSQ